MQPNLVKKPKKKQKKVNLSAETFLSLSLTKVPHHTERPVLDRVTSLSVLTAAPTCTCPRGTATRDRPPPWPETGHALWLCWAAWRWTGSHSRDSPHPRCCQTGKCSGCALYLWWSHGTASLKTKRNLEQQLHFSFYLREAVIRTPYLKHRGCSNACSDRGHQGPSNMRLWTLKPF